MGDEPSWADEYPYAANKDEVCCRLSLAENRAKLFGAAAQNLVHGLGDFRLGQCAVCRPEKKGERDAFFTLADLGTTVNIKHINGFKKVSACAAHGGHQRTHGDGFVHGQG